MEDIALTILRLLRTYIYFQSCGDLQRGGEGGRECDPVGMYPHLTLLMSFRMLEGSHLFHKNWINRQMDYRFLMSSFLR